MTAAVGIWTFSGLTTLPVVAGGEYRVDSIMAHKYPILGRDALSCDTSNADTSETSAAPAKTTCALVQVQVGKRVYVEITPSGHTLLTADSTSPIWEGNHTIPWGEGWRLSVKEVA